MRLHTNPRTGEVMTGNMTTSEMPRFLHPSHGQMFQFANQPKAASRKKYLLPGRAPIMQDIIKSTLGNTSHASFASSLQKNTLGQSFGHSSSTMKVLMKDITPIPSSMSRSFVNNRILNTRKEYMIPTDQSVRQKTNQSDPRQSSQSFFKPGEFAKLTGNLNRSKILMRERQPQSPRTISRLGELLRTKQKHKLKKFNFSKNSSVHKEEERSKVKSTIYDYRKLYEKQDQLDPQSLQNTMNHILAFNQILKHVDKQRDTTSKKRKTLNQ